MAPKIKVPGSKAVKPSPANNSASKSTGAKGRGATVAKPVGPPLHSMGNTMSFAYFDKRVLPSACEADDARIKEACKPESDTTKAARVKKKGGLLSRLKIPGQGGPSAGKKHTWVDDHCELLMIKPSSPKEMFDSIKSAPEELAKELGEGALNKFKEKAEEKLEAAVKNKLKKMAIKQGIIRVGSFLLTPAVGIAVNIIMTADGLNDLKNAAKEFPELKKEIDDAVKKIQNAREEVSKLQREMDKYKDPTSESGINEQALVSDMMYGAAEANPCIQARRCALAKYSQTHDTAPPLRGKGCCPGQSGHHILPNAMFSDCPGYSAETRLTICVEGVNNSHGSHGKIHENMRTILSGATRPDGTKINQGETMSMKDAISAATRSVTETFPNSKCDPDCIRAQLEENYKKLEPCEPKNESGAAGTGNKKQSPAATTKPKPKPKPKAKSKVKVKVKP